MKITLFIIQIWLITDNETLLSSYEQFECIVDHFNAFINVLISLIIKLSFVHLKTYQSPRVFPYLHTILFSMRYQSHSCISISLNII